MQILDIFMSSYKLKQIMAPQKKHDPKIVKHLYRQGFTNREIMAKLKIKIATLMRYKKTAGITIFDEIAHLKARAVREEKS